MAAVSASLKCFKDWHARYLAARPEERRGLLADGAAAAHERRAAMARLIQTDPEGAVQAAMTPAARAGLPPEIASLLEESVSGRGILRVSISCDSEHQQVMPVIRRTAYLNGRVYQAFFAGELGQTTQAHLAMTGVAVDGRAALQAQEGNGDGVVTTDGDPPQQDGSAYTEGTKRLILIRVDFSDKTGIPLSDSTATNLITGLSSLYGDMSYGITDFTLAGSGSDITPTYRMPQPSSYYTTNSVGEDLLRNDARAAATAGGWNLANYDFDIICFGGISGWSWIGLANVGAPGAWIRGSFSVSNVGHELGHNLGLRHANYWQTTDGSVAGAGTSVEYGDSFDIMGASSSSGHFNGRSKGESLNWIRTNEFVSVTSNNTYRIFALEPTVAPSPGLRALKIARSATTNYWVDFKQQFTANRWLMSGAGLRMAPNTAYTQTQLLDTTPGSTDGKNDAAIVIGRTYADPLAGVYITPIGKGGTWPESLDVVVNLGSSPTNVPPTVTLTAPATNGSATTALTFSANASDANGDALAYYWDFGDRTFGSNSPAASHSWSSDGEYVVRCTVSDMKGGQGGDSLIVRIGSPTTYSISGIITNSSGAPVSDVRVYVSTLQMTYTDSDGTYNLVGLAAGSYTVSAVLPNYTFAANFVNPISVGPSQTGIGFLATATGPATAPFIITQPASQLVNASATVSFSVAAGGTQPLYYQWRFNGANIGGATGSSFTKTNVQASDAGNYSVVVTNLAGAVTSANAVLTVNSAPQITAQPQSQTVIGGTNVTFAVTASGTAPLSYQWRFSGTNIPGATASTCVRTNAQAATAGDYLVVVTNNLGAVTSAPASLVVNYLLNATATAGGAVYKSPDHPSYAPNSTVVLSAVSGGVFLFAGWAGAATGTSNPVSVTMTTNLTVVATFTNPVPDIIVDNTNAAFVGTWATATAAADKFGPDYRTITTSSSGGASATFTPNIAVAGRYDVYVWTPTVSGGGSSAPSTAAPLIIRDADTNLALNVNQSINGGAWQLLAEGRNFAAGTAGFIRLTNNAPNPSRTVIADAVRLSYSLTQGTTPPHITVHPASLSVVQGSSTNLNVAAGGTAPLSYQWRFGGTNLSGATNGALALNTVQPADAGDYDVIVANLAGSVTSAVATVTVLVPPTITVQPQGQNVIAGQPATFTVVAAGSTPLSYQWRHDDATLTGATDPVFNVGTVHPADGGLYAVVITNVAGSITSAVARLTVLGPSLADPASTGNAFQFSLFTAAGLTYSVEYKDDLSDSQWSALTNIVGTGSSVLINDDHPGTESRFYRVRVE